MSLPASPQALISNTPAAAADIEAPGATGSRILASSESEVSDTAEKKAPAAADSEGPAPASPGSNRSASAGLFGDSEDDDGPVTSRKRRHREHSVDDADAGSPKSARSETQDRPPKLPSFSPSPPPAQQSRRRSRSPSRARSDDSYARREALEYREEVNEGDAGEEEEEEIHANLMLPAQAVRQGRSHWVAKLPSFLDLSSKPFDEHNWDPTHEDATETGTGSEARIADEKLRSLLRTTNTVRWRWRHEQTADGKTHLVPESNARIVTWSDGSVSMQLGKELFDLHMQAGTPNVTDKTLGRVMAAPPPEASGHPALAYLVVPDADAQVLSVRTPISGAVTFQPSDVNSKTHRRLAAAVKHQRVAKVTTTEAPLGVGSQTTTADGLELDPEQSAALEDRRLKDIERRKQRERKKAEERYDDDLGAASRRRGAGTSALAAAHDGYHRSRRSPPASSRGGHRGREEEGYEEDDFVVTDEEEEEARYDSSEEEVEKSAGSEHEPDGEEAVAARRRPKDSDENEDKMDVDEEPEDHRPQHRRRVVIESDED